MQPDTRSLDPPLRHGARRFASAGGDVQAIVLAALVQKYRNAPPPASFRMLQSPLIAWIWIGGIVALLGALTAAWPGPHGARGRKVTALAAARLGRDLARTRAR